MDARVCENKLFNSALVFVCLFFFCYVVSKGMGFYNEVRVFGVVAGMSPTYTIKVHITLVG